MKKLDLILGIILSIGYMFWYAMFGKVWYHHFLGIIAIVCFMICSLKYDS
jgi:hypothetical protein